MTFRMSKHSMQEEEIITHISPEEIMSEITNNINPKKSKIDIVKNVKAAFREITGKLTTLITAVFTV